jgi:hypothetical protein
MKKSIIIHPILLSIYPTVFLYSNNFYEVSFMAIILPLILTIAFTIINYLFFKSIIRSREKAGLLSTLLSLLFFFYGYVYDSTKYLISDDSFILGHRYLLFIWFVIFISISYFIIKTKRQFCTLTRILNIISIIVILFPIYTLGNYILTEKLAVNNSNYYKEKQNFKRNSTIRSNSLRDIYYIILDAYANSSTLLELYNFQNNQFTDDLKRNGFYIASEAVSNYAMTFLSLSSSLNMEYLNYLSNVIELSSNDRSIPYEKIINNKVFNIFKNKGYKIIQISSDWGITHYNKNADLNISVDENRELIWALLQRTVIFPFISKENNRYHRNRVLNAFTSLKTISEIEGPKFVFAHIICPHAPYVFGENGEEVDYINVNLLSYTTDEKIPYLNQLKFLNKKVLEVVSELLSKSSLTPIIIIQGDHGPSSSFHKDMDWNYPTEIMLKERMRIFSAYLLPKVNVQHIRESITPVNNFRLILNEYFNEKYLLYENKSFFSNYSTPYKFQDVTKNVMFKTNNDSVGF